MAVTFCEIFVNSLELVAFGNHKRLTLIARFRSILSGRDWVYLSGLLVPLVVYNLVLKGIRIDSQEELPGGFAAFALIRSDLLFNLGYVFLWVGLFALTRRSRLRWPVVVLFHTVTIVVIATTTAAHGYFQETGSTLSLSVITYSLGSLGEITDVIGSVTSLAIWAWVLVILGYLVLGPWIIATLVCGKRGEPRTLRFSFHIQAVRPRGVHYGVWGSSFSRCLSVPGWPENPSPGTPSSTSSCQRWSTPRSETSSRTQLR